MINCRFIGLLFLIFAQSAQAIYIDTTEIIDKANLAFKIEHQYPDSAYVLAHQILSKSNAISFDRGRSYALLRLASVLKKRGHYDSAMSYIAKAIKVREKLNDLNGIASAFTLQAYVYKETGKLDSAFHAMMKAIRYDEKANNQNFLRRF